MSIPIKKGEKLKFGEIKTEMGKSQQKTVLKEFRAQFFLSNHQHLASHVSNSRSLSVVKIYVL
jgi:hypothetical protein